LFPKSGGVSNVDIDGNNALYIKAIGVVISTFETLPESLKLSQVVEGRRWWPKTPEGLEEGHDI